MSEGVWSPATVPLPLHGSVVHIWRVSLERTTEQLRHLWQVLSREERQRAQRFHFERDRIRFIASHGALRLILARYVETDAPSLEFQIGPAGKPILASPHTHGVTFNLSHSGQAALVVVARDREVGIDLEQVRPIPQAESIVDSIFSPDEQRCYRATPAMEREDLFFRLWTRRESLLKATGQGLTGGWERSGAPPWQTGYDGERSTGWWMRHLTPYPSYIGAVAVAGLDVDGRCFDWTLPG